MCLLGGVAICEAGGENSGEYGGGGSSSSSPPGWGQSYGSSSSVSSFKMHKLPHLPKLTLPGKHGKHGKHGKYSDSSNPFAPADYPTPAEDYLSSRVYVPQYIPRQEVSSTSGYPQNYKQAMHSYVPMESASAQNYVPSSYQQRQQQQYASVTNVNHGFV